MSGTDAGVLLDGPLPEALVLPVQRRRATRLLRSLPADVRGSVLFECRVPPAGPRVDVSVCLGTDAETLAQRADQAAAFGGWADAQAACRAWTAQADDLDALWMEVDLSASEPSASGLPQRANVLARVPTGLSANALARAAAACRGAHGGAPSPPGERAALGRLLEALPAGAWIAGIGAMVQRQTQPVQVFVKGMTPAARVGLLRQLGLDGAARHAEAFAKTTSEGKAGCVYTLALRHADGAWVDRFGMEVHPARGTVAGDAEVLQAQLATSVAEDVAAWCGARVVPDPGGWGTQMQVRTISHLKAQGPRPGETKPLRTKVYLWVYRDRRRAGGGGRVGDTRPTRRKP